MINTVRALTQEHNLSREDLLKLITCNDEAVLRLLYDSAEMVRDEAYGKNVFFRGLIEFTNYCKNNCCYCGIRRDNQKIERYRLTPDEILQCCAEGYALGFRTFVLQGGEDGYFTTEKICSLTQQIKTMYPDCAVTLSVGERSKADYQAFFDAGADRYLLRHETANSSHYSKLHPQPLSLEARKKCLYNLKEIGFQTGAGFMVGSPYQTDEFIVEDLLFLKELNPQMVGIRLYSPL